MHHTPLISEEDLNQPGLPIMMELMQPMVDPGVPDRVYLSKDVRWQTWTDNSKDVHIDHHFDDD